MRERERFLSQRRRRNFRESPDELWPHCLLQLSAIVDGIYAEHGHTAGSFTHLASDRLLVGGGADARSLQGAKGINNFVGCLRKVSEIRSFVGSAWSTLTCRDLFSERNCPAVSRETRHATVEKYSGSFLRKRNNSNRNCRCTFRYNSNRVRVQQASLYEFQVN